MNEQARMQKLVDKLTALNLQPETQKQSRIDSSETKFRTLENRFEEFMNFAEKRTSILQEQLTKLEKTAAEEKRLFADTLAERLKSLGNLEAQFSILIDHEIKVR
jgi:hypothetical protein